MPVPRFHPDQFEPSGWDSGMPERKAKFVNSLLRFVADGFPEDRFTRLLYLGLSNHGYFGFIAHYEIRGFYAEQLATPERRARFVRDLAGDCEREAGMDRPDLWTDVKAVLAGHLAAEPAEAQSRLLRPFPSTGAGASSRGDDPPTLF